MEREVGFDRRSKWVTSFGPMAAELLKGEARSTPAGAWIDKEVASSEAGSPKRTLASRGRDKRSKSRLSWPSHGDENLYVNDRGLGINGHTCGLSDVTRITNSSPQTSKTKREHES